MIPVDKTGQFENWGNLVCPNCQHSLGYCAEVGDEITCDNCGTEYEVTKDITYLYRVTKQGREQQENDSRNRKE